jgi:hypothetical protein
MAKAEELGPKVMRLFHITDIENYVIDTTGSLGGGCNSGIGRHELSLLAVRLI